MKLWWFFALFVVSGFCSLVYEVVWLRLAMASFGVTTPMVSIVLSVFMAGLALGSWAAGRWTTRLAGAPAARPLRLYALAELVIAVSGVVVPAAMVWGRRLLADRSGAAEWGSLSHYAASGAWITLSLLPFCTCMGATLPLAMAAIRRSLPERSSLSFSYLYLANVIGASLGPLAAAFVLVETLGFRGTLLVTAALNAGLAVAALALSRGLPDAAPEPAPAVVTTATAAAGLGPRSAVAILFMTGLVSMAMEVVWLRLFTPYVGTVVYAFASILSLYLLGTFVGSRLYRTWALSARGGEGWLAAWPVVALSSLLPLVAADPRWPAPLEHRWVILRVVFGVVPFCAAMGFVTPLLVDRVSGGDPRRAGSSYAANVVGCILGPLVCGFAVLPFLGERWSLLAFSIPLWVVASRAALTPAARRAVLAAMVLGTVALVGSADYERIFPRRIVRRDATATSIAAGVGRDKVLVVNGIGVTGLTPITKMMGHLPMASVSLDRPAQNALVICLGMGTTFRSLLSWGIPVTAVELVPSVPGLFPYFHADGGALLRLPRARVVVDDGRRFLERTSESFDVITLDPPPPPEAAGSSLLYSEEFYRAARKRLRPGGILQQWFPGGDDATVSAVTKALLGSFPHVRVFHSAKEKWGLHFLARDTPLPALSAPEMARRMPPQAGADLLEWDPGSTCEKEFQMVLDREESTDPLIARAPGAPMLRDDRPVNEYYFLRRAGLLR